MTCTRLPGRLFARGLSPLLAALVLAMLPARAALAQSSAAQGELPSAESLFERHVEAIGGWENLDKLKNRRITGTYKGAPFEFAARLQVWWERDEKFHQYVGEPGGLRYSLYVNGNRTWAVVADNDPMPITASQRIELLDTTDFLGEANYKDRYKSYETAGSGKADGEPVWIVRAVTSMGRPHTLFFSKESGLVLGTKTPATGEAGKIREMMVKLVDYKDFGGVLYPTKIIQQFNNGEETNTYTYNKIEVNTEDEHDYTVPEEIETYFAEAERRAAEQEAESDG